MNCHEPGGPTGIRRRCRDKARPPDWSALLSGPSASEQFMDAVEKLPPQERTLWTGDTEGLKTELDCGDVRRD